MSKNKSYRWLYELEDVLRDFIMKDVCEFYADDISNILDITVKEAFDKLIKFATLDGRKIYTSLEVKCPSCKKRIKEFKDFSRVEFGKTLKCDSCKNFKIEKDNTYILFKIDEKWIKAVKEIEGRRLLKMKKKELSKIRNEEDIIRQLNSVLDTFENIPEGGLSIEGKILKSQIKTYLDSSK